ncbi:MAG: hypothetical protein DCC75_08595 [Proteobacteria bacterium]|nr:MAG: hypothetical protein DCC75_08595 [Pseudomonadota bacterium]
MDQVEEIAKEILKDNLAWRAAKLLKHDKLAGDASGRRFYRLHLQGGPAPSAVLLLGANSSGPKLGGRTAPSQEETFLELGRFFRERGIAVPAIYQHLPARCAVLVEDVGELPLWRFVKGPSSAALDEVMEKIGADYTADLYKRAIGVIKTLKQIVPDKNCIAFNRHQPFEMLRSEASEFIEFFAEPTGLNKASCELISRNFEGLCETMRSFPPELSHFDFNSFNLFVDRNAELRVLDYQDACLTSPARDIVSLINDRGMDETLGESLYAALLQHYISELKAGPAFALQYDVTLLHWDFRVVGRFKKLNQKYHTTNYDQWIPGTLRRLGRTLARSFKRLHGFDDVLQALYDFRPECKEGVNSPWRLPL